MNARTLAWLLPVFLALGSARAQEYIERDIVFRYVQYAPSSDLFDSGWGIEGSVRRWQWDRFGYAIGLGLDDYTYASHPGFLDDLGGAGRISGSLGLIPVQASLLWAPVRADELEINVELGLRYMVSITSADVVLDINGFESSQPIDMADAIAATLSVEASYRAFESGSVVLGVGMQQDVIKGEYGVRGVPVGDTELSAPFGYIAYSVDL